jgi:Spy/CpxP family protein refolding chaperone
MKPYHFLITVLALAVVLAAAPALAEDDDTEQAPSYGYGYRMGMGQGYGGSMGGYHHGWGMGPNSRGWNRMSPENRQKWRGMWAVFAKETLALRQQLASKHMELRTEWAQPKADMDKVKKLSNEVAELQAELDKKRNEFLGQCRQNFGDQGWPCPGGGYRGGGGGQGCWW